MPRHNYLITQKFLDVCSNNTPACVHMYFSSFCPCHLQSGCLLQALLVLQADQHRRFKQTINQCERHSSQNIVSIIICFTYKGMMQLYVYRLKIKAHKKRVKALVVLQREFWHLTLRQVYQHRLSQALYTCLRAGHPISSRALAQAIFVAAIFAVKNSSNASVSSSGGPPSMMSLSGRP